MSRWFAGTPKSTLWLPSGKSLPQRVLDIPSRGALNIHASLLPRWRGAAPMQTAIRAGDPQTGVSVMLMEAGLDSGPVLAQRPIPLKSSETAQSLHDRLAPLGAELLMETLPAWLAGRIDAVAQDESQVTLAPMLRKEDGRIDWSQPAQAIERQIRAFTPWPGSFTTWDGTGYSYWKPRLSRGQLRPAWSWQTAPASPSAPAPACCSHCACNWRDAARRIALPFCAAIAASWARAWACCLSSPALPPPSGRQRHCAPASHVPRH